MATKTSKTIELHIQSSFDGDQALDVLEKQAEKAGGTITKLTSVYDINAESQKKWSHNVRLAAKDVDTLNASIVQVTKTGLGNLTTGNISQEPLKERLEAFKKFKKESRNLAEAQLRNVKLGLKEELAAEKEASKQKIALRREQEAQFRQIQAARDAREKQHIARNRELLTENNRTVALEKLIISKGANDIAVISERLAQKEVRIAEKLQHDLAEIARRGANREIKNIPAARTSVFANYRRDILDVQRELTRAEKSHATAQAQELQRTSSITRALRKQGTAQKRVTRHIQTAVRAHRHWSILIAEGIGLYRTMSFLITSIVSAIRAIPNVGIALQTTQAVFEATLGSATASGSAFVALDKEAKRTGISISALRENFRNLNASMTLAGEKTSTAFKVFTDLNTVSTALHLSGDKVRLTFLAISQIFNKSKVQSEELVKQLGNLLPGAFASFQQANKDAFATTQDLVKAMQQGTVTAHDTVANFLDFYANRFRTSFAVASVGLQANIGRTQTSFVHLGEAIFNVTQGSMVSFLRLVQTTTDALTDLIKNTNILANFFKGTLILILIALSDKFNKIGLKAIELGKGLFTATERVGIMAGGFRILTGRAALAANAINLVKGALAFFLKTPTGLIITLGLIASKFADIGKEGRKAADRVREIQK